MNTNKLSWFTSACLIVVLGNTALAQDQKDHAAHALAGLTAINARDYKLAVKELTLAFRGIDGQNPDNRPIQAKYAHDLGKTYLEWFKSDDNITQAKKRECLMQCLAFMRQAAVLDRTYIAPRQTLYDIYWQMAYGQLAQRRPGIDWSGFIEHANALLELDPKNAVAWYRLGVAWSNHAEQTVNLQAARKGLDNFRKAIALDSDNIGYWGAWLTLLKWTEARDTKVDVPAGFAEAFKANPKSAALRIMYASYLRQTERSDEAREQLMAAIQCEPKNASGQLAMASFLAQNNRCDEALKHLQAAEAIDPTHAAIYLQRSRIHRINNNLELAVKSLQAGVVKLAPKLKASAATQPKSRETRAILEKMNNLNFSLANAALDRRRLLKDQKQRAEMTSIARQCLKKLDNLPHNSPHQAKLAGRLAMVDGDRQAAIRYLEHAFKAFRLADLQTPALLITLYDQAGMPGKSEKMLLMLQKSPKLEGSVEILLGLARLKIRYKNYEGAENYINRALRTDPKNKTALQLKNAVEILMGKTASPDQAGAISKPGVKAIVEQIDAKWASGQQKEAIELLASMRKALPKDLLLAERDINMHMLQKDPGGAKAIIQQMLTEYPDNENLKFQASLIGKTPEKRLEMQLARIDASDTNPLARAMAKVRVAARAGKKDMTSKFLAEAIALKPDDPNITAMQFRIAMEAKDWATALSVVKRVEKADETRSKLMRSHWLTGQKKYDETIELLAPMRKDHPNSKLILRTLGECYLQTKAFELAEDVFGVMESNDPSDATALIGLAMVAQQQGRMDDNKKYVMRAYRTPHGRKHSYINRRYLEILESNTTGDEIKTIIQRREVLLKRNANDLDNLHRLARLYEYRTRDIKRAEELYHDAYEKTGRSLQWGRALAFFYVRTGQTAKGEAVLTSGARGAKSKTEKIDWITTHADMLSTYNPKLAIQAYNYATKLDPKNPTPYRPKAALFAKSKNWPAAIQELSTYVALRTEDIKARKTLIQYRLNARQYDQAEKELETILSKNPTDAQGLILNAILVRMTGRPARSIAIATEAIERYPKFAGALSVRARAYVTIGELELAAADLERADELSNTPQYAMELAGLYMRLGRENDAIALWKSIVSKHKNHQEALFKLIEAYLTRQDWNNAESSLTTAQKQFPKTTAYRLMEAKMWDTRKQETKALDALKAAVEINAASPQIARAYLLGLVKAKQYDKAIDVANSYRNQSSWNPWITAIRARVLVAKKQGDKADKLFLSAVGIAQPRDLAFIVSQIQEAYGPKIAIDRMIAQTKEKPSDWYLKVLLGDLCSMTLNDHNAKLTDTERTRYLKLAEESFKTALENVRKPAEIAMLQNRLGKVYYDAGKFRQAEKAYLKCLETTPNDNAAINNLAYMYVSELNEPEKALPYAQKIIRLRPQDPNVLDTYGWMMAKLKRYREAQKYLQRAIELDPKLTAARYHLGWVFEQTRQPSQAIKQYRMGLKIIGTNTHLPTYKLLKDSLKRLEK
ncbi:MAG: tetratricopeptide repeat protein [Phycisphaerales bacterium]|jgi:tetratricopeptide (TPR) repeat protein|nr:tetratricopeptide repeat protein [Phycisphaerales bacterium]